MSEYIVNLDGELGIALAVACAGAGFAREEIVRCRDCRMRSDIVTRWSDNPLHECLAEWCKGSEGDHPLVDLNGFCAWGKRIDEIVHCRDCCLQDEFKYCERLGFYVGDDGFCAWSRTE